MWEKKKKLLILVFLLIGSSYSAESVRESLTIDSKFTIIYQTFTKVSGIDAIRISLVGKYQGYLALGIGFSMSNGDMMVGRFQNGVPKVEDRVSTSRLTPPLDAKQDLTVVAAQSSRIGDTTTITFQRLLNTGDSTEDKVIELDQDISIMCAWGSSDAFDQHQGYITSSIKIKSTLQTPTVPDPPVCQFTVVNGLCVNNITPPSNYATILGQDYILYWDFNDLDQTVEFMIQYQWKGWFGLGFGEGMFNVDMIYGNINQKDEIVIYDSYSRAEESPEIDAVNNVILLGYSVSESETIIQFKRKLDTGDKEDQVLQENTSPIFCMAYTKDNNIRQHPKSNSPNFRIQFQRGFQGAATIIESSKWQEIHNIVLLFGWGFLTDFFIIFARFLRHMPFYLEIHAIFFFVLNLLSLILESAMLNENREQLGQPSSLDDQVMAHFVIGCIFLAFFLMEHIGGSFLQFTLEGKTGQNEMIPKVKQFHQYFGMFLYLLAKIQVLIGVSIQGQREGESQQALTPGIIMIIIILIRVIVQIYYQLTQQDPNKYKNKVQQIKSKLSNDQNTLISAIQKGVPTNEIVRSLPKMKWFMLNRGVFNVTDIFHPGGIYIFDQCVGRQIGRFFYGAYNLESDNRQPFNHTHFALGLLYKGYLGEMPLGDHTIFVNSKEQNNSLTDEKLTQFMLNNTWSIADTQVLSKSTSVFYYQNSNVKVQNFLPGVEWIGRHFTIKHGLNTTQFNQTRLYTTVLYFTEENMKFRTELYATAKDILAGTNPQAIPDYQQVSAFSPSLPFAIQKYDFPQTLSQFIFENSQEPYAIDGPMGRGLEMSPLSKGKHIFFAGGTGILPFIDLLDFIYQKVLLKCLIQSGAGDAAQNLIDPHGCGYSQAFNDPTFSVDVYWAVADQNQFFEAEFFSTLCQLAAQAAFPLQFILRSSQDINVQGITSTKQTFDAQFIQENLNSINSQSDRVFICGPPMMNQNLPPILKSHQIKKQNILLV